MSQSPLSRASDDRLAEMLFAGEDVEDEVTVDDARIVVTSHRVLAFTPDGDGRVFDHADRPNVLDVQVRTTGEDGYLTWGVRSVLYGAVLLGGGYMIHSSGILRQLDGTNAPENQAVGGVNQLVETMSAVFMALTEVLLLVGGVLLLVAASLGALYYASRSDELVIERAGGDPIRIPVEREDDRGETAARRLRTVVGTGSNSRDD